MQRSLFTIKPVLTFQQKPNNFHFQLYLAQTLAQLGHTMSGARTGMPHMNGTNNRRHDLPRIPPHDRTIHQHDDLIRYIFDSWSKVSQEVERNTSVLFYQEQENHNLKDFEPFDLEGFWGRRTVQNYQQGHHHHHHHNHS